MLNSTNASLGQGNIVSSLGSANNLFSAGQAVNTASVNMTVSVNLCVSMCVCLSVCVFKSAHISVYCIYRVFHVMHPHTGKYGGWMCIRLLFIWEHAQRWQHHFRGKSEFIERVR